MFKLKVLLVVAFCELFQLAGFSQITGNWTIDKFYPEVSGLSNEEIRMSQKSLIGQKASIGQNAIVLNDVDLAGLLSSTSIDYKLVDVISIPDSMSTYIRFFCQEIPNFSSVTKQTIKLLCKRYQGNYIRVWQFVILPISKPKGLCS